MLITGFGEDYLLLNVIGKGSYGIVYRGKCHETDELLAIKMM
jgi:serine/threonine protein kinase